MAGGYWPLSNLHAATAEVTALHKSLFLIEQFGCSPTIMEFDSLDLCQAYNGEIEAWSPYTTILVDCFIRAANIGSITVRHCSRESNTVAHKLARFAFDSDSSLVLDGDPLVLLFPMYLTI